MQLIWTASFFCFLLASLKFWLHGTESDTDHVARLLKKDYSGIVCAQNFSFYELADQHTHYKLQTHLDPSGRLHLKRCATQPLSFFEVLETYIDDLDDWFGPQHIREGHGQLLNSACSQVDYNRVPLIVPQQARITKGEDDGDPDRDGKSRGWLESVLNVVGVSAGRPEPDPGGDQQHSLEGTVRSDDTWHDLVNGIFPGTKWCGFGNIAEDIYHELGEHFATDSCCRSHDLCRPIVESFSRKYNYYNPTVFTLAHCSCDVQFFNCLKAVNTSVSREVGRIFFNLANLKCFDFEERDICTGSLLGVCYSSAAKCAAVPQDANPLFT